MRNLLAVLGGVVAGVAAVAILESLGHALFPPPVGLDPSDPATLAQYMEQIPFGAKFAVIIAWICGIAAAAIAAIAISRDAPWTGWVAAGILFAFTLMNLAMIPHPTWMMLSAFILLPASTFLAQILAGHLFPAPALTDKNPGDPNDPPLQPPGDDRPLGA